jgi:predicted transcriptional regulator
LDVEDVFSSKLRVKILRILWQLSEANVSEIARRLGVNHKATVTHLKFLEDKGILQHKVFGRIRLYRFNEHSSRSMAIQNFFQVWEKLDKQ